MSKGCGCVYYDNGKCQKYSDDGFNSWCVEGSCTDKTPSHADRIRAMTDEEMSAYLLDLFKSFFEIGLPSKEWMTMWLKWPVEGDDATD